MHTSASPQVKRASRLPMEQLATDDIDFTSYGAFKHFTNRCCFN